MRWEQSLSDIGPSVAGVIFGTRKSTTSLHTHTMHI